MREEDAFNEDDSLKFTYSKKMMGSTDKFGKQNTTKMKCGPKYPEIPAINLSCQC